MAKVRIIIRGVAVSYHKDDGIWKILFPFDDCHTVKFGLKDGEDGISLGAANRQISVRVENPVSRFAEGENYEQILDLTADFSHADGIRMKSDWAERGVLMTIENAVLSEDKAAESDFVIKNGDVVKKELSVLGYESRADLEGDRIILDVSGDNGFQMIFERDATLIFDNDCKNPEKDDGATDMEMFYTLLEDKNNSRTKFTVDSKPNSKQSKILSEKKLESVENNSSVFIEKSLDSVFIWKEVNGMYTIVRCHVSRVSNVADSVGLP